MKTKHEIPLPIKRLTGRRRRIGEKFFHTLEYQLCEILQRHCGQRGYSEGAVDTLCRIISERDRALEILALDRLKEHPPVW